MKKMEVVVHPSQLNVVRTELARRGICGQITLTEVRHGDTHKPLTTASNGLPNQFEQRVKLELIVPDRQVDKAVNVLLRYAVTPDEDSGGQVALFDVTEVLGTSDSQLSASEK
jgi:nitrogen regulatory protein PII